MPVVAGQREPFLSALDSRAAVKGSRDALGAGRIWIPMGRMVIGNVTTVARSVRDFTTTALGYLLADQVIARDPVASRLTVFLKTEQLIAHIRIKANPDIGLRGSERVQANLLNGSRITFSPQPRHQILANQRIYGLWGYYTGAARASGLLTGDPPVPTDAAIQVLELIMPGIASGSTARDSLRGQLLEIMRRETISLDLDGDFSPYAKILGKAFQPRVRASEVRIYRHHLLHGGDHDTTDGRQRQLAELLSDTLPIRDFAFHSTMVGQLAQRAARFGPSHAGLADALRCIERASACLAITQALFRNLLCQDGVSINHHAAAVKRHLGTALDSVQPAAFIELLDHPAIGLRPNEVIRWTAMLQAMARSDVHGLIHAMVDANGQVMAERGGAPWLSIERGILRVAMRDDHAPLPSVPELMTSWPFPFFLNSLRDIAQQLEHPARG